MALQAWVDVGMEVLRNEALIDVSEALPEEAWVDVGMEVVPS